MPAPDQQAGMEIRSFHVVFRLERRLHRIDRWRLPFPHGVPIAAIGHAAAVLAAIVALGQLPGVGTVIGALPAPVAYVLAPCGAAAALTRLRIDGRPAHRHLLAKLAAPLTQRRTAAGRPAPLGPDPITGETLLASSPASRTYLSCEVTGPATVTLRLPARARARARTLHLAQLPGRPLARGKTVRLAPGQRLKIRGDR